MTNIREPQIELPDFINLDGQKIPPPGRINYEEFLDWADEDTHAEWVDGEVLMTSPASYRHQAIKGFLESSLLIFTQTFDLGIVLSAGFQMKLPSTGREPDVLFVSKARSKNIKKTFLKGPADLVVEIVSPESVERDNETKYAEYAEGGVPEYWLIDPLEEKASFYQLDKSKQYHKVEPDSTGKYYSKVVSNFWLKVEWLWQQPLPEVAEVLLEVGGETYQNYLLQKINKKR